MAEQLELELQEAKVSAAQSAMSSMSFFIAAKEQFSELDDITKETDNTVKNLVNSIRQFFDFEPVEQPEVITDPQPITTSDKPKKSMTKQGFNLLGLGAIVGLLLNEESRNYFANFLQGLLGLNDESIGKLKAGLLGLGGLLSALFLVKIGKFITPFIKALTRMLTGLGSLLFNIIFGSDTVIGADKEIRKQKRVVNKERRKAAKQRLQVMKEKKRIRDNIRRIVKRDRRMKRFADDVYKDKVRARQRRMAMRKRIKALVNVVRNIGKVIKGFSLTLGPLFLVGFAAAAVAEAAMMTVINAMTGSIQPDPELPYKSGEEMFEKYRPEAQSNETKGPLDLAKPYMADFGKNLASALSFGLSDLLFGDKEQKKIQKRQKEIDRLQEEIDTGRRKTGINSTIGISAEGLEKKKERLESLKAEQSEAVKTLAPQMEQNQQENIPVSTGSNVGAKSESNKSARKGSEQVNITLNNNSTYPVLAMGQ